MENGEEEKLCVHFETCLRREPVTVFLFWRFCDTARRLWKRGYDGTGAALSQAALGPAGGIWRAGRREPRLQRDRVAGGR